MVRILRTLTTSSRSSYEPPTLLPAVFGTALDAWLKTVGVKPTARQECWRCAVSSLPHEMAPCQIADTIRMAVELSVRGRKEGECGYPLNLH
jgi:hypothetical protein